MNNLSLRLQMVIIQFEAIGAIGTAKALRGWLDEELRKK